MRAAYDGPGEWVDRCRATPAAPCSTGSPPTRPRGASCWSSSRAVGPEFHDRFEAGFDRFVAMIDSGLDADLPSPAPLPTDPAGGRRRGLDRVYAEVAAGRTAELPALLPS